MFQNILVKLKHGAKKNRSIELISRSIFKLVPVNVRTSLSEASNNPYSNFEDKNNVIFVHVPKTGGNSITNSIFGSNGTGHDPISRYKIFDEAKFTSYFSFAFTRNPWDRFVSAYFYLKKGGIGLYDSEFYKNYLQHFDGFEDFVHELRDKSFRAAILKWTHFKPQTHFLCIEGEIRVDFLGAYENLYNDYELLLKTLDISEKKQLEQINYSHRNHYKSYYSDASKRIIGEIYESDIEILKYQFE